MGWCTAQWKNINATLLCETIMKESSKFELAHLEKKKKKSEKTFWPSGNFLVQYFHDAF